MEIRIIGTGNMGSALAYILAKEHQVSLYDIHLDKARSVAAEVGAVACSAPAENLSPETLILLAVKPQDLESMSQALSQTQAKMIVSVLAGVSLASLKKSFPHLTCLRMMPNLAVRYGEGVVVLAGEGGIDQARISQIFASLGLIHWSTEKHFDALTSLIGSGPGFVFALIEAMLDAATAMGLSSHESLPLIKQMMQGSLTLLEGTGKLPHELKLQVTSPGGTTIAGLRMFEEKKVRHGIIETFLAAYQRSKEL